MRRHHIHTSYFTVLLLTLALILSFVDIPVAISQNSGEIISELRELQEEVSKLPLDEAFENTHAAKGQRKALTNKINATIHKIKAGAYKGAINKLENDLKNAIKAWITEEYERSLIEKVDRIIKLIKGELYPPDFDVSPSPTSLTIQQGGFDSSTLTITSLNGFSAAVDLAITSSPITGVTTTLDPTQVTPPPNGTQTSMLSVQVGLSALPGTHTLTVTGTSGEITHSTEITLKITELAPFPDFSIEASPASLTILQGGSDTATITITSLDGFNQPVQLSVSGAPLGVTTTLDPEQVTPPADDTETSTLTVSVDISAKPGIYILTVSGKSDLLQHSVDITLEITQWPPPQEFSIEANPAFLTIVQGNSDTSIITVTSINGFNQLVDLVVTSNPILGVTTSLDPVQVTPPADGSIESTLRIDVDLSSVPATYTLTVTGTSSILERNVDITLEVTEVPPTPDFDIRASPPSLAIFQGESATSTIIITSLEGFSGAVDLTVSGEPMGVIATLNPAQVTPPIDDTTTSTLTIDVNPSATPGIYTLTVTGTSGLLRHEVDIELTVATAPDFSLSASPTSLTIQQGGFDSSTLTITSLNGFSAAVDLAITSSPITGVTTTLDPTQVTPPADDSIISALTVQVGELAALGTYTLTVTGTSGSLQHSVSLSLEISQAPLPPDAKSPTVRIDEPANGSYVAGLVNIAVFMYDENFKKAELTVNNILIALWTPENVSAGEHSILWKTTLPGYPDGAYDIALSAEDEAGNTSEKTIGVIVDNTSPIIESAAWTPQEPSIDEQVDVTVEVNDPQPGSGIHNVTLWYRNTTVDDWQPIPMSLNVASGNWTATIPAQSTEVTIQFYIEAFDNLGNRAVTDDHEYDVATPAGIPLAWIIAIILLILLILAATASAIYFGRKRRREKLSSGTGSSAKNYKLTLLLCF